MFKNITLENLEEEHLCCIIRSKKGHPGIEAKRNWLCDRITEGHVFRKLDIKGCVFIEYAPLETAWVPIEGDNYLYIYCLWTEGEYKGKGYGKELLQYCISDAKAKGKSGICMLGAHTQKHWLTDQSFAKHFGFQVVDQTSYGYELLALSFDGIVPHFTKKAKEGKIKQKGLVIYYDDQCPYIPEFIRMMEEQCNASCIHIESMEQSKDMSCVFNNYAVFYDGVFQSVNLLSTAQIHKIMNK